MFGFRLAIRLPYLSRVGWLLTAAVGLNVISAGSAAGQSVPLFTVYPFVQVNEMFDDNVELSQKNRVQDAITNTLLGCNVDFSGNMQTGRFTALTALQTFAEHPGLNDFANTEIARYTSAIRLDPSTTLNLDDSFVRAGASSGLLTAMEPELSPQFAAALLSNVRSTSNYFDLTARHESSEVWSTLARVTQSVFDSNTTGQAFAQGLNLGEEYKASEQTRFGLTYEFDEMRFSRYSRSEAHFPRVYLDWTPSSRLKVKIELGPIVSRRSNEAASVQPGFQLTGKYSLRRLTSEISAAQTPATVTGFAGTGLLMTTRGYVSGALSRRVSIDAGVDWYRFTGNGFDAQILSYGIGATYRVNRNVTVFTQCWRVHQRGGIGSGMAPTPSSSALIESFGIRATFQAVRGTL